LIVLEEDDNERLIHPMALIGIVGVMFTVLFLLFPDEEIFQDKQYIENPDILSVAYLSVMLEAEPENVELRLVLAKQLQKVGQIDSVNTVMAPIDNIIENDESDVAGYDSKLLRDAYEVYIQQRIIEKLRSVDENEGTVVDEKLVNLSSMIASKDWLVSNKYAFFKKMTPFLDRANALTLLEDLLSQSGSDISTLEKINATLAETYLANGDVKKASSLYASQFRSEKSFGRKRQVASNWLKAALGSGEPEHAYTAVSEVLSVFPQDTALLNRGYHIAVQTNHIDQAIKWLQREWDESHNPKSLVKLFDFRLATGELEEASKLAEILIEQPVIDKPLRKKIAELYMWTGENAKSLEQWLLYAEDNPDKETRKTILRLFALYSQYDDMIALLQAERKKGKLSITEYLQLTRLRVHIGDVDTVDDLLFEAILKFPENSDLYLAQYKVLQDQERYEEAGKIYALLKARFPITIFGITDQAKMLWAQRAAPEALSELQSFQMDKDFGGTAIAAIEYWLIRAELSAYLDKAVDLYYSYEQLQALEQTVGVLNEQQIGRLAHVFQNVLDTAIRRQEYSKVRVLMEQKYQRTADIGFLQKALTYALAGNDYQSVERILDALETRQKGEVFEDKLVAQMWSAKAQLFSVNGDIKSAHHAWLEAIALFPKERSYREAWLWLLIGDAKQNKDILLAALGDADNSFAFQQQAFGRQALGDHRGALAWFGKGLSKNQHDWSWLSAMSNSLEQTGYSETSYLIRMKILELMAVSLRTEDSTALSQNKQRAKEQYLRLYGVMQDSLTAQQQATREFSRSNNITDKVSDTIPNKDVKNWLVLALEYAMANGQEFLIEHYRDIAALQGMELPGWQQLSIALRKEDHKQIQSTLEAYDNLPISDKTIALERSVSESNALAFGLEALSGSLQNNPLKQQRRVVAPLRAKHENGFRLLSRLFEIGDISVNHAESTVAFSKEFGGDLLDFTFSGERYQFSNKESGGSRLTSDLMHQLDLKAGLEFKLPGDYFSGNTLLVEATLHQKEEKNVAGLHLDYAFSVDKSLISNIQLNWRMRSAISSSIYAAGYTNNLSYNLRYLPDSRSVINSHVSFEQYSTIDNAELGSGVSWLLAATHRIFVSDPTWTVTASHQGLRYNRASDAQEQMQQYFIHSDGQVEGINAQTILPSTYQRSALGTALYHGNLHRLTRAIPSPRYTLSADVGFDWNTDSVDLGVKGGIGWRMVGDDELAVSLDWNSGSASGEDRTTLTLSYANSFTR